jgi:pyrroline-5-carboxylate reductase
MAAAGFSTGQPHRGFHSVESSMKICVLGSGNMAEAILSALTKNKQQDMTHIVCHDLDTNRLEQLKGKYGIRPCESVEAAIEEADITFLSVKPQNVASLAKSLSKPPRGLLLSIVAGYTIDNLSKEFGTDRIVRSMPNTPAMVLEGMTVWTATKETPKHLVDKARVLLSAVGEQIEVKDESYLDMATAVSGSGPAYVFLTMEAMIDAAVHVGFPRDIAVKLVTATMRGSVIYAQSSGDSIPTLRNQVTSPGGTTASALYELERGGFRTVVADAIWAAYRRSLELGGSNPNVGPGRNKWEK